MSTKGKKALSSAPPPWHSLLILSLIIGAALVYLPPLDKVDEIVNVTMFTRVLFPAYLTLRDVAYIRLAIASSIWFVMIQTVLGEGWEQSTSYLPGTKLIMVKNKINGWKTLMPFTSFSWIVLGIAFSGSGWIAYQVDQNSETTFSPWLLRSTFVAWELAAPNSLLVATVIRYAIWPAVLRATGDTSELRSWRNKFMHNFNVVYALTEAALLGGLPVISTHLSFPVLFGCLYVIISWNVTHIWNTPDKGPQFLYFFMDTTQPGWAPTIALLALLLALIIFYALFSVANSSLANLAEGNVVVHVAFVVAISSLAMRFRD